MRIGPPASLFLRSDDLRPLVLASDPAASFQTSPRSRRLHPAHLQPQPSRLYPVHSRSPFDREEPSEVKKSREPHQHRPGRMSASAGFVDEGPGGGGRAQGTHGGDSPTILPRRHAHQGDLSTKQASWNSVPRLWRSEEEVQAMCGTRVAGREA